MTLIFAAERNNEVVLMADTLVSFQLRSRASKTRPISQINERAVGGVEGIADQIQKIVYLDPTLAVACAGDPDAAVAIIRHIAKQAAFPISQADLRFLVNTHPDVDKVRLIFFGIEKRIGDRMHTMTLGSKDTSYVTVKGDRYHFAGSGAQHFHVALAGTRIKREGPPTEERQVYSLMLDYFGKFALSFATEILEGTPFEHAYGGGFEMLFVNGHGQLTKVPYKILLWIVRDGRAILRGPIFNFHYSPTGVLFAERIPLLTEELANYAAIPIRGLVPELQHLNSVTEAPPVEAHLIINEGSPTLSLIVLVNKPSVFQTTIDAQTRHPLFEISPDFLNMLADLKVSVIEILKVTPVVPDAQ